MPSSTPAVRRSNWLRRTAAGPVGGVAGTIAPNTRAAAGRAPEPPILAPGVARPASCISGAGLAGTASRPEREAT